MTNDDNVTRVAMLGGICDWCREQSDYDDPVIEQGEDGWFHPRCHIKWLVHIDESPNLVVASFPTGDAINLTWVEKVFHDAPQAVGMVIDEEHTEIALRFEDDPEFR